MLYHCPIYSGTNDCLSKPVGMENKNISYNQITASSSRNLTSPTDGRLNGNSAWCADIADSDPYIQVSYENLSKKSISWYFHAHCSTWLLHGFFKLYGLFMVSYWIPYSMALCDNRNFRPFLLSWYFHGPWVLMGQAWFQISWAFDGVD